MLICCSTSIWRKGTRAATLQTSKIDKTEPVQYHVLQEYSLRKGVLMKTNLRNMTAIYITDVQNQNMLMLYRIGSKVVEPSWCGIGGHFEQEELNDPQTCMLRELQEEIGLQASSLENLKLRYVTLRLKNGEVRQNSYYFADLKTGKEVNLVSNEDEVKWIPFEEVMDREMPLTAKFMLTHYMETGRFTDCLYGGVSKADGMTFTQLKEF